MTAGRKVTSLASNIAAELFCLSPEYAATPLLDLPRLAARLGVAQVLAKNEGRRMLGSFKSLGGTYAGLQALARVAKMNIANLVAVRPERQPILICASDGNHGLAVAAAARFAGATARVYLHSGVPHARAQRISEQGAEIVRVNGTYDDSVDAAAAAARGGAGILIADTTDDPHDPVVQDVMAGYGVIAEEIRHQVKAAGYARPTHLFVQAGVGGLAAAVTSGLGDWLSSPGTVVVVEPASAPAVAAALAAGRPVRVDGGLESAAEMLSCGEASAPALCVLRRHNVQTITVSEAELEQASTLLRGCEGPATTPSGSAGLAGAVAANGVGGSELDGDARVLIIITETELQQETYFTQSLGTAKVTGVAERRPN